MVISINSEELGQITEEDKVMLRDAEKRPLCYDEDCPPLTAEEMERYLISKKRTN